MLLSKHKYRSQVSCAEEMAVSINYMGGLHKHFAATDYEHKILYYFKFIVVYL
jgi:hypothetical protein